MRAGAVAHALDPEFGKFGNRRHTGAGQNIHGGQPINRVLKIGAQVVDDNLDVLRVAQAGNKDAVGAGLEIGLAAFKSTAHSFFGLSTGLPVSVRPGVDDEMNSRRLGGAACGLDARNLLRQRKQRAAVADVCVGLVGIGVFERGVGGHYIFKVHADGTRLDDLGDGSLKGCNVGGEAGLNIGSDGDFDGAADAGDSIKHLRPGKVLPVWETESVGHGGAAGGDGRQAAMLNHGGAGCVPGVDEDERLRGVMQLKQP